MNQPRAALPRTTAAGRAGKPAAAAAATVDTKKWVTLLLVFTALDYTRLPTLVPPLGILQVQALVGVALFYFWVKFGEREDFRRLPLAPTFVMTFFSALSIIWANNWFYAFNSTLSFVYALVFFALPATTLLVDRDAMRKFARVFASCGVFVAIYAILHSGRGPGGFIGDENDTGLFLNITVAFAILCARDVTSSPFMRLLFWAGAITIICGVVMTDSRGAFVGLLILFVALWWSSRHRFRMALVGMAIMAVLPAIVIPMLPDGYLDEMQTSMDPNDSTRVEREYFWGLAMDMYAANPVVGVGTDNYPWTVMEYEERLPPEERAARASGGRAVHSMYMQLLSEQGSIGALMFLTCLVFSLWKLNRLRKVDVRGDPNGKGYDAAAGGAIFAGICTMCASGAFISVLYSPTLWYLVAVGWALCKRVQREAAADAAKPPVAGDKTRRGIAARPRSGRSSS